MHNSDSALVKSELERLSEKTRNMTEVCILYVCLYCKYPYKIYSKFFSSENAQ